MTSASDHPPADQDHQAAQENLWVRLGGARSALIIVCVLHALSPLLTRGLHAGLGWDETVYISQLDPHVMPGDWSAPRARGLTFLTAPASYVSSSLAVMRLWLSVVSGVGLYLALFPWLRVRRGATAPLAAALWSCLWITIVYGFEAMPNQYVAYGALSATGWLLLVLREPGRRREYVYLAAALAATALVRPTDAVFLAVPLVAAAVLVRGPSLRQRAYGVAAVAVGLIIGVGQWVIEAYLDFGGPVARFHAASAENTGGLHFALGAQMRTLGGPALCRNTCHASAAITDRLWWFALVPLVAIGLAAARRQKLFTPYVLAVAAALIMAAQYIFAIDYSAPRFLEPSYALLALPVAEGLLWLRARASPALKPATLAAFGTAVLLLLVSQVRIVSHIDAGAQHGTAEYHAVARALDRAKLGNCVVQGLSAGEVSFYSGCSDHGNELSPTVAAAKDLTEVAVTGPTAACSEPWAHWSSYAIGGQPEFSGLRVRIDLPPSSANKRLPGTGDFGQPRPDQQVLYRVRHRPCTPATS